MVACPVVAQKGTFHIRVGKAAYLLSGKIAEGVRRSESVACAWKRDTDLPRGARNDEEDTEVLSEIARELHPEGGT